MIVVKESDCILDKLKKKIKSRFFMESSRMKEKDFTRSRKMPFALLVCFMLNSIKQTIQKELTHFIQGFTNHVSITKSAFCQHRIKLKPEAFIDLNDTLIEEFYTDNTFALWNGFRLLSIDGSALELPKSEEIMTFFGVNSNQNNVPMAKISALYDLLNNLILDSDIAKCHESEYNQALKHLEKLKEKDLLVLDRGYAARWLFYILNTKKVDYVIRLQHEFGNDIDEFWNSPAEETILTINEMPKKSQLRLNQLEINNVPFKVRLIKIILDNGDIEVLATSLLNNTEYPLKEVKELYQLRWGIETNYSHLKNHIELGNFTGYSVQVIKQDFYANALLANIQSLIIRDAQRKLDSKTNQRQYDYKINKNLSLGYLKDRVIEILLNNNKKYYQELVELFQIEPVPIRKGRKFPRQKTRYKKKYHINQKRSI